MFEIVRQEKADKGRQGAGRSEVTSTLPFAVRALGRSSGSVRPMQNQPNLISRNNPPRVLPLGVKYNQPNRAFFGKPASPWLRWHLASLLSRLSLRPAASSDGCDGGGFAHPSSFPATRSKPRCRPQPCPSTFLVKGKYVEFTVDAATFGLYNWTLTGAPNPLDITGGKRHRRVLEQAARSSRAGADERRHSRQFRRVDRHQPRPVPA